MTSTATINIANDFSAFPAGRFFDDGMFSGERFREEFLIDVLRDNDSVIVTLDGTRGYGSSFLEEAFGGLVRLGYFSKDDLRTRLHIECQDDVYEPYVSEIWDIISQATPEQ